MKIAEIINTVEMWHAPLDPDKRTCDGLQYGDVEKECTGIAVTCCLPHCGSCAKGKSAGIYNLIIGHEPLFLTVRMKPVG